jgi:hypothetical protein
VLVMSMLMMFMHLGCAPYSDCDSTVSEDLILPRHLDDISITVGKQELFLAAPVEVRGAGRSSRRGQNSAPI